MLLSFVMTDAHSNQCPKALDFEIKRLGDDKVESLCKSRGNVILVVNTASKCGFTPQYEGLEKLYSEKRDQGFVVLGFPSHDFYQEPAPEKDIKDFTVNFDIKSLKINQNVVEVDTTLYLTSKKNTKLSTISICFSSLVNFEKELEKNEMEKN